MRKTRLLLIGILVLGALLRFWNLSGPDMVTDDALYSFRAIGYFDFAEFANNILTLLSYLLQLS